MAILKVRDENNEWQEVSLGGTNAIKVSDTTPVEADTEIWVDTSSTQTIADYVVEQGVTNGWNYTKWNSGKIEMYIANKTITTNISTGWGSAYASPTISVSLPLTLLNTSYVISAIKSSNTSCFVEVGAKTTSGFSMWLMSPQSMTSSTVGIDFRVIGTWK